MSILVSCLTGGSGGVVNDPTVPAAVWDNAYIAGALPWVTAVIRPVLDILLRYAMSASRGDAQYVKVLAWYVIVQEVFGIRLGGVIHRTRRWSSTKAKGSETGKNI